VTFNYAPVDQWDNWMRSGSRAADCTGKDGDSMKHARRARRVSRVVTHPCGAGLREIEGELEVWMMGRPGCMAALERLVCGTSEGHPHADADEKRVSFLRSTLR
jgi:hypothetical protein